MPGAPWTGQPLAEFAHLLPLKAPGEALPAGVVLGTVRLVDVVTDQESPWAEAAAGIGS